MPLTAVHTGDAKALQIPLLERTLNAIIAFIDADILI